MPKNTNDISSLFHHVHHICGEHQVHHCGGEHTSINKKLDYQIEHCDCGLHKINRKIAIGHTINAKLNLIEVEIKFLERCPHGGWHVESGIKINNKIC